MEIRAVRESELEEMIELQCLIFDSSRHARYTGYVRGDSTYRLDQTRVAVEQGRIVATLRIWDRRVRIGSCTVPTAGIGGVGTHPEHRRRGLATALMRDAMAYMQSNGYCIGMLFADIPRIFYRNLGWDSLPTAGFCMRLRGTAASPNSDWDAVPFDEERDLEDVVKRYDAYNANRNGTFVRDRPHWDSSPARARGTLPTIVVRRGSVLGGYVNLQIHADELVINEIAYDRDVPETLGALIDHLSGVCVSAGIDRVRGEIPPSHPLVYLLAERWNADLELTGHDKLMFCPVDVWALLEQIQPELQSRLDETSPGFGTPRLSIAVPGQDCVLAIDGAKRVVIRKSEGDAEILQLPLALFWCLVFGARGWHQVQPTLRLLGTSMSTMTSRLMSVLFPAREVICWEPDHF